MKFEEMSELELEKMMEGNGVSSKGERGGRKEELMVILRKGMYGIMELSKLMGISSRNISSLVCYLRDDGIVFRNLGEKLVLWGKVVGGEKVGNRIIVGGDGEVVRFNFKEGLFEDEIK